MGVFQDYTRLFYLGAMILMLAGFGAAFFPSGGTTSTDATRKETPTATAEATETATHDPNEIRRTYAAAPPMQIDPKASYQAVIHTDRGDVCVQLLGDKAPTYVNNFVFLANAHFYDGLTFHRVEPNFVVQAGDPPGRPTGPGYSLTEEKNDLTFEPGVLAMAKAGPTVNGSQFFITIGPASHLNADFTVFGRVIEGLDLLGTFPARPLNAPESVPAVTIQSVEVLETPAASSALSSGGSNG
ncbi:MAG: peptidylprolyl isomerase [Dehalococcoidia bacterium]|nr:peptidylprolyl isomerase [Dehalococcoidia bacterium]